MSLAKLINVAEKSHYPFAAWPKGQVSTVLFPGCSFPSYFPRTTNAIVELCRGWGMGVAYDCCGRSLAGYGKAAAGERVIQRLSNQLLERGVTRMVTLCPNCLDHLGTASQNPLGIEVISIFQYLAEIGFEARTSFEPGQLFIPCPDKKRRQLEALIRHTWDLSQVDTLESVGCCGLRPEIFSQGIAASKKSAQRVLTAAHTGPLYTYCSSCLGQFARCGATDCRHVLSVLLNIDEQPDATHGLKNRAARRFDRALEPYPVRLQEDPSL